MRSIPPPDPNALLPPVLACLPAAFLSPKPPPALLPLLAPILRQRVYLLSQNARAQQANRLPSERDSPWLPLLTYSNEKAEELQRIVGDLLLEPHPVTGELELFTTPQQRDEGAVQYRRLDIETLQARCDVTLYNIGVIWVWCENDSGGTGLEAWGAMLGHGESDNDVTTSQPADGWRVAEVVPLDEVETAQERAVTRLTEGWKSSMSEAEESFTATKSTTTTTSTGTRGQQYPVSDDGSDDYWAQYDQTPGRGTPARQASHISNNEHIFSTQHGRGFTTTSTQPQPPRLARGADVHRSASAHSEMSAGEAAYYAQYDIPGTETPARQVVDGPVDDEQVEEPRRGRSSTVRRVDDSDSEYYAQYDAVQPVLDRDIAQPDPMPSHAAPQRPSFTQRSSEAQQRSSGDEVSPRGFPGSDVGAPLSRMTSTRPVDDTATSIAKPPLPTPPAPPQAPALNRNNSISSAVDSSIMQHVSGEIKSLFRLCQRVGISRDEFERVVRRELEVLGLIDLEVE